MVAVMTKQYVYDAKTGIGAMEDWTPTSPPPAVLEDYELAIQSMIDDAARSRRYKHGDAFASYFNSTVGPWKDEAAVFIAWRDNVWQYAYSELSKVQEGEREQPTIEAFLLELPEIVWP
jgi:hypothetical protein